MSDFPFSQSFLRFEIGAFEKNSAIVVDGLPIYPRGKTVVEFQLSPRG